MSITKRKLKNGKTVFDIRVQYRNTRVSKTEPVTKTEAKRIEARLYNELMSSIYGIRGNRKDPKFKQYAEQYKQSVIWHKAYQRTIIAVNHLIKYFGRKRLSEITSQDFIDYRTYRLKEVSEATVNREHNCMHRIMTVVVNSDEFLIPKNPLKGIKKFKEKPAEDRTLNVEEYTRLLEVAPLYFRRILFFACHTGMRLNEILTLKFSQIKIWQSKVEIELIDTKSGKKEYVPMDEDIISLLGEIAGERQFDLFDIKNENRDEFVFLGTRGVPLKSVRKPMARTFKEAGVELRTFHTFRHFWTKMMFKAGNDPAVIQKIGRWGDFRTMLRYHYTTRIEEHDAVNKLGKALIREENNKNN